jgi:hypothetical protein
MMNVGERDMELTTLKTRYAHCEMSVLVIKNWCTHGETSSFIASASTSLEASSPARIKAARGPCVRRSGGCEDICGYAPKSDGGRSKGDCDDPMLETGCGNVRIAFDGSKGSSDPENPAGGTLYPLWPLSEDQVVSSWVRRGGRVELSRIDRRWGSSMGAGGRGMKGYEDGAVEAGCWEGCGYGIWGYDKFGLGRFLESRTEPLKDRSNMTSFCKFADRGDTDIEV